MMMGKLIVIEGPDRSGKGTQSRLLVDALVRRGIRVVRVEPTKESHPRARKMIYAMLESGEARRRPNAFQLLQFANRTYFTFFRLPELLRNNQLVVLDRWSLSGYVYGKCEGISQWLNELIRALTLDPDLTVILQGSTYARPGAADDSYEADADLQFRVHDEYRQCVGLPHHIAVDNSGSVQEVHEDIVGLLHDHGILWARP
jgi:thymidylate kinase